LNQKELEIVSKSIEVAFNKINGDDRESISGIKIVNPKEHEVELTFKGFNWEVSSFLSIKYNLSLKIRILLKFSGIGGFPSSTPSSL